MKYLVTTPTPSRREFVAMLEIMLLHRLSPARRDACSSPFYIPPPIEDIHLTLRQATGY